LLTAINPVFVLSSRQRAQDQQKTRLDKTRRVCFTDKIPKYQLRQDNGINHMNNSIGAFEVGGDNLGSVNIRRAAFD